MRNSFPPLGLAVIVVAALSTARLASAATFFDDLSTTTGGENNVDSTHWLAARFTTDGATYTSLTATLALDQHATGAPAKLDVYSDSGMMPSAILGSFTTPSTTLSGFLFNVSYPISGISLAPNTNYWLVLHGGFVGWGWTPDVTANWASSSDSGSNWLGNSAQPPQSRIVSGLTSIGDYSGNGVVDAADYTIWRDTLGSTTDLRANGNDSGPSAGKIDQDDYDFWQRNFGRTANSGAGAAVPEPSTFTLFVLGLIACVAVARRKSPSQDRV
jgi:PEP-CTERM motif-containing protein